MDPLSRVEHLLGAVETWPTHIIMCLFVEDPTDLSVRAVSEFMYGNRVPVRQAIEYFIACNGGRSWYVNNTVYEWYYIFDKNPCDLHKAEYYSMRLNTMAWLNGEACAQDELVQDMCRQVCECGMEGRGCERLIQIGICNVRSGLGNDRPEPTHPLYRV